MNHDELQKLMEEDELRDGIELGQLSLMSVADYAKARGMKPQLLHYYLRKGKLEADFCECGRKCIRVEEADAFFKAKYPTLEDKHSDGSEHA